MSGTLLYLDSARMGLMCERARLAHVDYIRLAGHEGCSLYFDRLFRDGFSAWPRRFRRRFRWLRDWQGIDELKHSLCRIVGLAPASPILLANRTAQLMRLAARLFAERCKRVLVTDLTWPSYRRILEVERRREHVGLTTVPLRREIMRGELNWSGAIDRIAQHYERMRCDGLLLPVVSHDGFRLPVDSLFRAISRIQPPRFTAVDGAQAFCHVPDQLGLQHCDLFIAGCHKWLQGHIPMGVAFLPNHSAPAIVSAADRMLLRDELDDPLLTFSRQLETESLEMFSETVNLSPLFSCRAAIADRRQSAADLSKRFRSKQQNAAVLSAVIAGTGWQVITTHPDFKTGIVLLQVDDPILRQVNPQTVRSFFIAHGISTTCYEDGLIRLSMPDQPFEHGDLGLLRWTLCEFTNTLPDDIAKTMADITASNPR